MTTKQYSKPQLLQIGDAVQATLLVGRGIRRDNRFWKTYHWRRLF
ncbi:hypothetical protein [Nostoc sp. MG11]|nr:hypothetical protein [Nostoc sp. MG11]